MRIFMRVIDEGTFAAAARAIDAAPAVVARAVADLEDHLGARLINRTTRRLSLTEIGQRYLERSRSILADVEEAVALASAARTERRGHVRVLCTPSFAMHQLAKRLPRFHAAHPQITVEMTAFGPVDSMGDGHDITIVVSPRLPAGDFVARHLARSEFIVCAAPEYLDRCGRPRVPADLVGHDAMMPRLSEIHRGFTFYRGPWRGDESGGESVTIPPPSRPVLTTSSMDLNYACTLAGLGITALPSFIAEAALQERALERVLPQWRLQLLTIWACMPTRKHVPASTRAFMDFLLAEFGGKDADPWLDAVDCPTELLSAAGSRPASSRPAAGLGSSSACMVVLRWHAARGVAGGRDDRGVAAE